MTSVEEAIDWLQNQKKSSPKKDLNRIRRCLSLLNIKTPYPIVHIAGTNGKGSTASFLKALFMEKKQKVGFFISPYVLCFNERIQVSSTMIPDEAIMAYTEFLKSFAEDYASTYQDTIPFFELTLLMALLYFEREKIDVAIIECGIGGLLDATNVLDTTVSVITNIGYDHMKQLGQTLNEIAAHKLGITRPHHLCFTTVDSKLKRLFEEYSFHHQVPMVYLKESVQDIYLDQETHFAFQNQAYHVPLLGLHQAYNAALAIAVFQTFFPDESPLCIQQGLSKTIWPGRFEQVLDRPCVILDGAHNLHGIEALVQSLRFLYADRNINILFTALKEKEYPKMIEKLDEVASFYYFTTLDDRRSLDSSCFAKWTTKPFRIENDLHTILQEAIQASQPSDVLVITGSLHFISLIRPMVQFKK